MRANLLVQLWGVPQDSAIDRGVVHLHASISHYLQISIAQRVAAIPADIEQDDLLADYMEMWQGLSNPKYTPAEPRTFQAMTPTTFTQFVREQLLPQLNQIVIA